MGAIFFDLSPLNVGGFFNETLPPEFGNLFARFPC